MKKILVIAVVVLSGLSAYGASFNRQPAGMIKGARLARVSASTITVGVGYGDIKGNYWEVNPTDPLLTLGYTLTGLSTSTNGVFHYIYIDGMYSALPHISLKNSTTAPSWSDVDMGWYNGDDRCIGAVWVNSIGEIASFICTDDETYQVYFGVIYSVSNTNLINAIDSTWNWNLVSISSYSPVNIKSAFACLSVYWSSGTKWTNCKAGLIRSDPLGGVRYEDNGTATAAPSGWIDFYRNGTRSLAWAAFAPSTSGTVTIELRAYKIER